MIENFINKHVKSYITDDYIIIFDMTFNEITKLFGNDDVYEIYKDKLFVDVVKDTNIYEDVLDWRILNIVIQSEDEVLFDDELYIEYLEQLINNNLFLNRKNELWRNDIWTFSKGVHKAIEKNPEIKPIIDYIINDTIKTLNGKDTK